MDCLGRWRYNTVLMAIKLIPISLLSVGTALAVVGYFLIGFHCPYSFVSTIMTGRILLLGILIPYKWILSVAICLLLLSLRLWSNAEVASRQIKPFADPALIVLAGIGIALIGFLTAHYPCPFPLDLWSLLMLEVPFGAVALPYGIILGVAACVLLFACFVHAKSKRSTTG